MTQTFSSPEFTLDLLMDLALCQHGNLCRNKSPFDLLGDSLKVWMDSLLGSLYGSASGSVPISQGPLVKGQVKPGAILEGRVYIGEGAVVEPTAYIQGPCYVGPGAEVRHGAYIRGNVYVGPHAVVGHTSEIKNSVLFDHAKAAHFAYVGDSILGPQVNLGAGTKLANLPLRRSIIRYKDPLTGALVSSGLKKFGALLGEGAQTGCNAVLSPGTILMPGTMVLPCAHFRGTLTKQQGS